MWVFVSFFFILKIDRLRSEGVPKARGNEIKAHIRSDPRPRTNTTLRYSFSGVFDFAFHFFRIVFQFHKKMIPSFVIVPHLISSSFQAYHAGGKYFHHCAVELPKLTCLFVRRQDQQKQNPQNASSRSFAQFGDC